MKKPTSRLLCSACDQEFTEGQRVLFLVVGNDGSLDMEPVHENCHARPIG
jgi:hypothetical protein